MRQKSMTASRAPVMMTPLGAEAMNHELTHGEIELLTALTSCLR